jgi:hypothetical protein
LFLSRNAAALSQPRASAAPPWVGLWDPCVVFCVAFVLSTWVCSSFAQTTSRLDVEDGNGLPGEGRFHRVTLTPANGLSSIRFALTFDPAVIQNVRLLRGDDTTQWETWEVETDDGSIAASGSTAMHTVVKEEAVVALFVFDVASDAVVGTSVPLILENAKGPPGFEIRSDLGTFVVGNTPPEPTERLLEFEISETEVFPGDLVVMRFWLSNVPELTNLQIFLEYPPGAFFPEGEVGGAPVESLGWDAFFIPEQPTAKPSILVTTFQTIGPTQAIPLGRTLVASVPIRIGKDWGGSWQGFSIEVIGQFIVGDISQGRPNYYARTNNAALFQEPPDFNQDGFVNGLDLFIIQDHWKGPGLP